YTRQPTRMSARSAWKRPPPAAMRACSPAPADALRAFDDGKALELQVAEIVHVGGAGIAVRGAEILQLRPGGEITLRRPHRVRGEQRVALGLVLGAAQQLEFLEAGHLVQLRIAALPDVLERFLRALLHLEAVHSDEHDIPFTLCG